MAWEDNVIEVGLVDCDHQEDSLDIILRSCKKITTYRDEQSVFSHLTGEVKELNEELDKKYYGTRPGADGILGESVDVLLCAVDMMYQDNPGVTSEEIMAKIKEKLAKWERVYG